MSPAKKKIGVSDEIWKSYKENRDVETRNFILIEYLHIVKVIAARMYPTYKSLAEHDDIMSCGTLALLNSIDRFDYTRDIKFETFASIRVRGAMIDYLRKQDWAPRTVRKSIKDVDAVYAELQNGLGREPTDGEIAEKLNMSVDDYYDAQSNSYFANILSLEELISDNASNLMPASDETPEKDYEAKEMTSAMERAIEGLSEKERTIISLYYYEGLKAKQIANILDVSESRISQLHSKALTKLKYNLQKYMDPDEEN